MKFTAPPLSSEKRALLERIKKWLTNRVSDLDTKKARLDKLRVAFEEAESRKNQFEEKAAMDADAALQLAGAQAQLSRLGPDVEQLQQLLEKETAHAVHQVNLVRNGDLRELLLPPLLEQLIESLATALSPFFAADWARQRAKQLLENTDQWRQISFYLNRPSIATIEFEEAKREINAFVGELTKVLAGETLIEA